MLDIDTVSFDKTMMEANKAAVLSALKKIGVKNAIVSFDGCADSGQLCDWEIELPDGAYIYDPDLLPKVLVERLMRFWNDADQERSQIALATAMEDLCYDLLEKNFSGWGNDDGAYGTFVFDVEAGAVTLEINRRYVHTTTVEA